MMSIPRWRAPKLPHSTRVDRHVVRRYPLKALRRIGEVVADFPHAKRVRNVDQPEALREPGKWNYRARKTLRWLVTAAHRRGRCALGVDALHLECADRDGRALVSNVVHPGECRRRWRELRHVFVRHDHDGAALELLRHRQAGMRWVREGSALDPLRYQLGP